MAKAPAAVGAHRGDPLRPARPGGKALDDLHRKVGDGRPPSGAQPPAVEGAAVVAGELSLPDAAEAGAQLGLRLQRVGQGHRRAVAPQGGGRRVAGGVEADGTQLVLALRVGLRVPARPQRAGRHLGGKRVEAVPRAGAAYLDAPLRGARTGEGVGDARDDLLRVGRVLGVGEGDGGRRPVDPDRRDRRRHVGALAVVDVAGDVARVVGDAVNALRRDRGGRRIADRDDGSAAVDPQRRERLAAAAAGRPFPRAASEARGGQHAPAGSSSPPARRSGCVTGSVLSTRSIAWPACADRIPDSETATAWT